MMWKVVPSFDCYEVSEQGQVRRCKPGIRGGFVGKIMKPYVREDGYDMYILRKNNKSYHKKAHQLVAEAFIGPMPHDKTEVCHNDGTRTNNHYSNLRYGTTAENLSDMVKHGTSCRGEKNHNSKLKKEDVLNIRKLALEGEEQEVLAKKYGVKQTQISRIVHRQRWAHV